MSQTFIRIVAWGLLFGMIWVLPFVYVFRGGKFLKGVGLCWGLTILGFLVVPLLVDLLILPHDPGLARELPEANSAVMAAGFGWVTGIIISTLALMTRKCIEGTRKARTKSSVDKGQKNA